MRSKPWASPFLVTPLLALPFAIMLPTAPDDLIHTPAAPVPGQDSPQAPEPHMHPPICSLHLDSSSSPSTPRLVLCSFSPGQDRARLLPIQGHHHRSGQSSHGSLWTPLHPATNASVQAHSDSPQATAIFSQPRERPLPSPVLPPNY